MNAKYLTVGWNNLLTFGLGIPTLIYGIIKIQSGNIGFLISTWKCSNNSGTNVPLIITHIGHISKK